MKKYTKTPDMLPIKKLAKTTEVAVVENVSCETVEAPESESEVTLED